MSDEPPLTSRNDSVDLREFLSQSPSSGNLMRLAVVFQGSLAALAVLLGWFGLCDHQQGLLDLRWESVLRPALIWGTLGTIPMLLYLLMIHYLPVGPFRAIRITSEQKLYPLLWNCSLADMVGLSVLAGLSEELLFRWCLQGGIADISEAWLGEGSWLLGLSVASIVFGLLHFLNASYAFLTALVGLYLGWMMFASGTYLAPALAHTLFDLVAIYYVARILPRQPSLSDPA